jgi:hypothetical protein
MGKTTDNCPPRTGPSWTDASPIVLYFEKRSAFEFTKTDFNPGMRSAIAVNHSANSTRPPILR